MQDGSSYSALIKEVVASVSDLVRSEVRLAVTEVKHNTKAVGRDAAMTVVGAVCAWLGTLALVSFLIIGLGNILGGRYWLSALIVSVVFFGVGGALALGAIKKFKGDIGFKHIPSNLAADQAMLSSRIQRVAETRSNLVPGVLTETGQSAEVTPVDFRTEKERRLSA